MTEPTVQRHFANSDELCRYVRDTFGDAALLSFSGGKDAIASWLQMRRYFDRIVPYYLYLVPGLEFVEEGLRYFEDFFKTPILRLPHPSLFRMLNGCVFQPPERVAPIVHADLPKPTYAALEAYVRARHGVARAYAGVGTRTADSPNRLANVRKYGALNPKRQTFLPVYDWRIDRLIAELKDAGIRLPIDYQLFGRSFDGVDYRFLRPLKEHRPRDYARVLDWFPMAELEIKRREFAEARS